MLQCRLGQASSAEVLQSSLNLPSTVQVQAAWVRAHFIWPSLAAKPSSDAVPLTEIGGEGAAEALISPASLLEDLCGPDGGIPLAVALPLWSPAHAATMPLRCDAGVSDKHAELRLHRSCAAKCISALD